MTKEELGKIRQLLSDGHLTEALDAFPAGDAPPGIVSLQTRHATLQQQKISGVLSFEEENTETNGIVAAYLVWISDAEKKIAHGLPPVEKIKVDDQLISMIKEKLSTSLRFYYIAAAIPIALGIGSAIFFLPDGITTMEGLGSGLISSIGGLSVRQIIDRRDRISFLDILLSRKDHLTDVAEIEKINKLSWTIVEKAILQSNPTS
jgi:hypothetical protein